MAQLGLAHRSGGPGVAGSNPVIPTTGIFPAYTWYSGAMPAIAYSDITGFKPYMENNSTQFKKILLSNGYTWVCAICGIEEWNGVPAPLQIDHVSGDRKDCTRNNIRFLCPNCHALTDTFVGKNKRASNAALKYTDEVVIDAYARCVRDLPEGRLPTVNRLLEALSKGRPSRSAWVRQRVIEACESSGLELADKRSVAKHRLRGKSKIEWPPDRDIESLLKKHSRLQVSKMLGVSDNAIKKRCAARGISEPNHRRAKVSDKHLAARDRARADSRRSIKQAKLKSMHGTVAGYTLERRLGVETCVKCRKANAESTARLRNRTPRTEHEDV